MLNRRSMKPNAPPVNSDDVMIGKCHVCGTIIQCLRVNCRTVNMGFGPMTRSECPVCRDRSPSKSGTAVEMVKKQEGK